MNQLNVGCGERSPAEKLIDYVRARYGLIIAELSAEKAITLCASTPMVSIRGRDATSGLPRESLLRAEEIVIALEG
jgi:actin-like ATPase involved in cell morphogenesis